MAAKGKKFKCDFLQNLSSGFQKILPESVPHTDLRNGMTIHPKLGAELEAPNVGRPLPPP